MSEDEILEFDIDSPFYTMVQSFGISMIGLEAVHSSTNMERFAPDDVFTLEGKVHPEIRLFPRLIHQQTIAGHYSIRQITLSLCGMWVCAIFS